MLNRTWTGPERSDFQQAHEQKATTIQDADYSPTLIHKYIAFKGDAFSVEYLISKPTGT